MITIRKLQSLKPATALRKSAYILHQLAQKRLSGDEIDHAYLGQVVSLVTELDGGTDPGYYLSKIEGSDGIPAESLGIRLEDIYYHILDRLGVTVADWDFQEKETDRAAGGVRTVLPVRPYLDRIRSPYNVGSIFRTAESFCCDKVLLAPDTASPDHDRAARTARGCIQSVPWEWAGRSELSGHGPVFALETGGTPIDQFDFPESGTVVVGSEEMGVSPELLAMADEDLGRVSIATYGAKGSLNVSVAFGILMQWWIARYPRGTGKH